MLLLRNGIALLPAGIERTDVCIERGRIARVGPELPVAGADVIDVDGLVVCPGFIDVHMHGAAGAMCEQGDADAIRRISETLPRFGVTGFLATIATLPPEQTQAAVRAVAAAAGSEPGARILGIHLEGPYLSPLRAGAQAIGAMRAASIEEFDSLQELSGGRIRLVTLAPETEGALAFIRDLRTRGVHVSVGHSDGTAEQMEAAIAAGATHVTHLFNAMRGLHHREPGVAGSALVRDDLSVELICDGHHLEPAVVDIAFRCKPEGKVVLVSDAVGALGMPDGDYEMFGIRCAVAGGAVRLREGGALAGSCLSLDRAVRNVRAWLPSLPVERILRAASSSAAAAVGEQQTGVLAEGFDADLVVLDEAFEPALAIVRGQVVWRRAVPEPP
jgi:N-acetylglucosamine-6-phosphate deacetylase